MIRLRHVLRPRHLDLGRRGERFAARWLRTRGYRILARNLAVGRDEIDLIVRTPDRAAVALVEVKTRREETPAPELAITPAKQFRLARAASRLQRQGRFDGASLRFDVVVIVWPRHGSPLVRHHPGAFESPF